MKSSLTQEKSKGCKRKESISGSSVSGLASLLPRPHLKRQISNQMLIDYPMKSLKTQTTIQTCPAALTTPTETSEQVHLQWAPLT